MPEVRRQRPGPVTGRPASRRASLRSVLGRRVWPLPRLVAGPALLGLVAWEGLQHRYSVASHASILAVIGATLLLALVAGRTRQRRRSRTWLGDGWSAVREQLVRRRARTAAAAGALGWVLVISATVGWDGYSFAMQRHSLPTLSRLFGAVTGHDWGRALVFAAWIALGLYLAVGWRLGPQGRRTDDPAHRRPTPTPPRLSRPPSPLGELGREDVG